MFVEQQAGIFQLGTLDEEIDSRLNNPRHNNYCDEIESSRTSWCDENNPNCCARCCRHFVPDGIVTANDTTDATNIGPVSVVKGGLGVAKKLFVGNDTSIAGNLTANNITSCK